VIDGIQLTYTTRNPKSHLLGLPCWEVLVNEKTGTRVNDIRTAHLRGLDLKLKPSLYDGHNFIANGSLHKFHNGGEHNADQFTFSKLLQSIDSFSDIFTLDPGKTKIHGLEIGVNINLAFPPLRVLKNLVCYRSRPFDPINKRSLTKGLQCSLTQYRVKVYDKAKQSGVECGNVLRFEVAVDKMQVLKQYGISTLADLYDLSKVYPLVNVLKETLEGIIWTDTTTDLSRLTDKEQRQWLSFSNAKTWQGMEKRGRYKALNKWHKLLSKYGHPPNLLPFVIKTWESLFPGELEAENRRLFYQPSKEVEAGIMATFLPLECTVKKSLFDVSENEFTDTTFFQELTPFVPAEIKSDLIDLKRFCPSCNREISHQRRQTVYCSEKLYGKAAKCCRNKISNKRRDTKRKMNTAMKKNDFLLITYKDEKGRAFSDVLHPSEIKISDEWMKHIQNIEKLLIVSTTNEKSKKNATAISKKIRQVNRSKSLDSRKGNPGRSHKQRVRQKNKENKSRDC
jgi:hypothetical protein